MNLKILIVASLLLGGLTPAICQTNPPASSGAAGANPESPSSPRPRRAPNSMLRPERYLGTLVKVDGNDLVIDARQMRGEPKRVTVATDSRTDFTVNGAHGTLEGLQPGMLVTTVRYGTAGTNGGKLRVNARDHDLTGTLVKVDGTNLVLKVSKAGSAPQEVTVALGAKTQIRVTTPTAIGGLIERGDGKPQDLKPGSTLSVYPPKGIPTRITVMPPTNSATASPQKQ